MRRNAILTVAACLGLVMASAARASTFIDLFADQSGTQCSLVDHAGLTPIYVFLGGSAAATAVQFAAPRPACWVGATWVGDGFPGPRGPFGNTQTGIQLPLFAPGVGECKTPPTLICTMYFTTTGAAQSCCDMVVVPPTIFPGEPYPIEYLDCNLGAYQAFAGHKVTINPSASCQCSGPLATEPTTWGRVKSLYR
jgi:hypothetical protein